MGSASFSYTGGWQTFNVPTGVTSINVTMYGGSSPGNANGGRVIGTIHVADTDTLYIVVGQEGLGGVNGGSGTHSNAGGAATFGAGGAGGAGYNANGGDSGGGYSAIRLNSTSGTIKCIAGGQGGDSGDSGQGGSGGSTTGSSGGRGTAGSNSTTAATGGSQSAGGQGGTSSSGTAFAGGDASTSVVGRAGAGGDTGGYDGPGGGGGGGGYYSGGGGQGGSSGWAPGGGGGGGSSYVGGMASVSTNDRSGGGGPGNVSLSWTDPDLPPATPTLTTPSTTGVRSLSTGSYTVSATVSAPPLGSTQTRALFRYGSDPTFSAYIDVYSAYRTTAGTCSVTLTGLTTNTLYYVRAYAQGDSGLYSTSYDTASFYTDYAPNTPTSVVPANGTATKSTGSLPVSCTVSDPDGGTVRARFRVSSDGFATYTDFFSGYVTSGTTASATLTGLATDTQYSMQVYAQDPQGLYSASGVTVSFWTNRTPTAPTLNVPANNEIFDSTIPQPFSWIFNDPDAGDSQSAATMRYRILEAVRTNLCTNPSFETDMTGWVAAGTPAPALATSTDFAYVGTQSLKMTSTGAASFLPDVGFAFPTVVGQTYTFSAYVYVPSGNPRFYIFLYGGGLGGFGTQNTTNDQWERIFVTFTATSTSHTVGIGQSSTVAGQIGYIDAAMVEVAPSAGSYFDGSTTDANYTYTWTGTANGSTSTKERTWVNRSLTTATSTTVAANTFPSNTQYEWQVQTTDAGGLTGPYSASNYFLGSPPVVNMSARAGLAINGVDITSQVNAMSARGSMAVTSALTKTPTVPMGVVASLSITPAKAISQAVPIAAQAGMTVNASHTNTGTVPMGGTASLTVDGTKNVPASLAFGATGGILFQSVSGDVLMKATAGMAVVANALNVQGTSAMGANASLSITTSQIEHPSSVPMAVSAGMTVGAVVSTQAIIGMAARASVSDSPGLSRIVPMLMSVRAQMAVDADPDHPGIVAISAHAGMSVTGFNNHPGALALAAKAGMTVAGFDTIDSGGVAMGATAGMTVNGYRSFTGTIAMGASAGIVFHQTQYTFDPPYLTAIDSHGDTLTFTRNSSPIPSKVTNKVTVTNTGNVTP